MAREQDAETGVGGDRICKRGGDDGEQPLGGEEEAGMGADARGDDLRRRLQVG